MSDEPDSLTAYAFFALAVVCGLAALIAVGTGTVPLSVGVGSLIGAASLWWMGAVVALLKRISHKLGSGIKPPVPPSEPARPGAPKPTAEPKRSPSIYKLD